MSTPFFRNLFLVFFWVLSTGYSALSFPPAADPALATLRIPSHGGSGTVIATSEGRSWLISCAHLFTDSRGQPSDEARKKPLRLDGPAQAYAPDRRAAARLVAWDYHLDLALIEIDHGPFHYVPVAKPGHAPSQHLLSLGYDDLRWPVTKKRVTLLASKGNLTFTVEKPWHGRSGGGLIDRDGPCLIGVVHGYELDPTGRGLYVSHAAVLRFLQSHEKAAPRPPPDPLPLFHQLFSPADK